MIRDPLAQTALDRPVALFLRHAERPELPLDETGHATSITDAGLEATRDLARRLGSRLRAIRSSPIRRCVETARALGGTPIVDPMLGDPGPYVADLPRVWSDWRTLGHDGVIARLVSGVDHVEGLHPIRATSAALVAHALDVVGDAPGVVAFVTHDVILAPLVTTLLGRPLAQEEWPAFLETLTIERTSRGLACGYRGSCHHVHHMTV